MCVLMGANTFDALCINSIDFVPSTEGDSITGQIFISNYTTYRSGRISKIVVDPFGVVYIESATYF